MDRGARERFKKVELKLSQHDEAIIARDKSLQAVRSLLLRGMRMRADMETKMSALMDSQTRLYGTMQQLAEAQRRTEASLKRFLDRSGNGRPS